MRYVFSLASDRRKQKPHYHSVPALLKIIHHMLPHCRYRITSTYHPTDNVLRGLQGSLSVLSPELIPIHERLVNIRRQLVALAAKETASQAALATKVQEKEKEAARSHEEDDLRTPTRSSSFESDMDSKTPTRDVPNPEPISMPKIKAELKPLQEELRKIDSLSAHPSCCLQRLIAAIP